MKYIILLSIVFFNSCFVIKPNTNKWNNVFAKENATGTFVLYNQNTKQYFYHNESRANTRYLPASTFKVLNSLIALETNVIQNENEIIKWDGIDRGWSKWDQDHSMKSAISVSCIWFYQELARRIGTKRMQKWMNKIGYGNKLMGSEVDDFWLNGDLKISAIEQINFLNSLIKNKLPFQDKNQEIVKRIMITDSTENYIIHSKSGWGTKPKPQIGWLIGYVEKKDENWIFALNIDINKKEDRKLRKQLVYKILKLENIIE